MHTVLITDHRWRFHSTTGKTTDSLQGITDTGSRIEVAIIAIGAPMTADTSIKAIATMGPCTALDITGNGNPTTGDITVTGGAITVVTVVEDTKCANPQHATAGLGFAIRGIRRMDGPDGSLKKT